MKIKIYVLGIIMLMMGCHEDKPTITQLFTFTVDQSYVTTTTDNWVVIHNGAGEPLDFKAFETGDKVTLETNKLVEGSTVGVTIISYRGASVNPSYLIDTYFDYPVGGQLTLETITNPTNPTGSYTGTFNVKLTSNTVLDTYGISNKFNNGCSGSWTSSSSGSTFDVQCSRNDLAPNYILTASDNSGNLKYKKFDNVPANSNYVVAFSDMANFDKYCEFKFPASTNVFLAVQGRESDQTVNHAGYTLQLHYQSDSHTSIKAGYLNSLSKYTTTLSAGIYYYYNKGGIPDPTFTFPDKNGFTIALKNLKQFSSTSASAFISRTSTFSYKDPGSSIIKASWSVNSSSPNHTLQELPTEIVGIHPLLGLSNFTHSSTRFYFGSTVYPPITPSNINADYVSYSVSVF